MTALFTHVGKQVLANGFHYADAADETAAGFIVEACNRASTTSPETGAFQGMRAGTCVAGSHAPIAPSAGGGFLGVR